MPDLPENINPAAVSSHATLTPEADHGDCFAPSVPQVSVAPTLNPAPRSQISSSGLVRCLSELGILRSPAETNATAGTPTSVAAEDGCDAGSLGASSPSTVSSGSQTRKAAAPVPQRKVTAAEIFGRIKESVAEQTHLPEAAAELVSYWIISTWFQDVLRVLPCLVITGPMYHASLVLDCLRDYCLRPARVAGFRRSDLGVLRFATGISSRL